MHSSLYNGLSPTHGLNRDLTIREGPPPPTPQVCIGEEGGSYSNYRCTLDEEGRGEGLLCNREYFFAIEKAARQRDAYLYPHKSL
jgi:hypothetical protein